MRSAPYIDKAARTVQRYGRQAYIAATRFFNSPTGAELTQGVSEEILGLPNPLSITPGDLAQYGEAGKRLVDLGTDLATGGNFDARHLVGGLRIEKLVGRELTSGPHPGIDFVAEGIGAISLKGPLPGGKGSVEGLAHSVIKDATQNTATNVLYVDLTGFSAKAQETFKALVKRETEEKLKDIIYIH